MPRRKKQGSTKVFACYTLLHLLILVIQILLVVVLLLVRFLRNLSLFQTDYAQLLRKSIKVHTESAVREIIHLYRIARAYKRIKRGQKNEPRDPSMIMLFDNGFFTTVAGDGEMFISFCRDKILGSYSGRNYIVRLPDDDEYRHAPLRMLPFDRCFNFREDDVNDRKIEFEIYFLLCRVFIHFSITILNLFTDEAYDAELDTHQKIPGVDAGYKLNFILTIALVGLQIK